MTSFDSLLLHIIFSFIVLPDTRDDVVVKGPCDSGRWDSADATGQQEALPLVEGHVSKQLSEEGVSVNSEGHCVAVLSDRICGNTGVTACILGLEKREGDDGRMFACSFIIWSRALFMTWLRQSNL